MCLHQLKCRMDYRALNADSLGVWALASRMSDAFLVERASHEDTTPYHRAK
jgi:hypothetical protein